VDIQPAASKNSQGIVAAAVAYQFIGSQGYNEAAFYSSNNTIVHVIQTLGATALVVFLLPMASTFFTWLRSPAAREYFFSELNHQEDQSCISANLFQVHISGDQFVCFFSKLVFSVITK